MVVATKHSIIWRFSHFNCHFLLGNAIIFSNNAIHGVCFSIGSAIEYSSPLLTFEQVLGRIIKLRRRHTFRGWVGIPTFFTLLFYTLSINSYSFSILLLLLLLCLFSFRLAIDSNPLDNDNCLEHSLNFHAVFLKHDFGWGLTLISIVSFRLFSFSFGITFMSIHNSNGFSWKMCDEF